LDSRQPLSYDVRRQLPLSTPANQLYLMDCTAFWISFSLS